MTELLQVSCRSHHHIGVSTFKIAGYQHSTFHLPRSIKHYKMCGRAEHPVLKIHICERNHIVAKAWRNSGHNNKNTRDVLCSYVFHMSQKQGGVGIARRMILAIVTSREIYPGNFEWIQRAKLFRGFKR